eukprot:scaffold33229_cov63-Phaeocystis_antarctica.AAC.1
MPSSDSCSDRACGPVAPSFCKGRITHRVVFTGMRTCCVSRTITNASDQQRGRHELRDGPHAPQQRIELPFTEAVVLLLRHFLLRRHWQCGGDMTGRAPRDAKEHECRPKHLDHLDSGAPCGRVAPSQHTRHRAQRNRPHEEGRGTYTGPDVGRGHGHTPPQTRKVAECHRLPRLGWSAAPLLPACAQLEGAPPRAPEQRDERHSEANDGEAQHDGALLGHVLTGDLVRVRVRVEGLGLGPR